MRERRDLCDRDRGFTLTELVIVIAIVGVLSVVLASVFSVIVRNAPAAEAKADDARSLLGLSTWLPADISSTPFAPESAPGPAWDRAPGTPSGCSGASPGVNLLRLQWTESFGTAATTSTFTAAYRYVNADGGWRIKRYYCENGGVPSVANMTSILPAIDPATWTTGSYPIVVTWQVSGSTIVGAKMAVQTVEGDKVRVDGSSNNPAATLPPLGTVVADSTTTVLPDTTTTAAPPPTEAPTTTAAPGSTVAGASTTAAPTTAAPTTAAPTTTVAPTTTTAPPCVASIVSVSPNPVRNQQSNSSNHDVFSAPIVDDVVVKVTKTSGNCASLGLEYKPITNGTAQWKPFGSSSQVILPEAAIEPWDDGPHTLVLRNGQFGTQVGATATLEVS